MATSIPSQLKEKVTFTSSNPSPSTTRQSPRPPGSPNHHLLTTLDKPTTHNYVKAKSSTSTIRSPTTSTTNTKTTTKKSVDIKPPSPIRKAERTLSTPNKERLSPKPPSPSPLPRPQFLRTSNSYTSDNKGTQSLTKNKSSASGKPTISSLITRSKSLEKRKEIVATPSAYSASDAEILDAKDEVEPKEEEINNHSDAALIHEVQGDESGNVEHVGKHAGILTTENENEVANDEGPKEESKHEGSKEDRESIPVKETPKEPVHVPDAHVLETEQTTRGVVVVKKEPQKSNDVIEEAKGKFLEKRKNKVLALVGAFETVMALQEPEDQQSRT